MYTRTKINPSSSRDCPLFLEAQRDPGEVRCAAPRLGQPSPNLGLMLHGSDSQGVYVGVLAISRNLLEMQTLRHLPSPSLSLLVRSSLLMCVQHPFYFFKASAIFWSIVAKKLRLMASCSKSIQYVLNGFIGREGHWLSDGSLSSISSLQSPPCSHPCQVLPPSRLPLLLPSLSPNPL